MLRQKGITDNCFYSDQMVNSWAVTGKSKFVLFYRWFYSRNQINSVLFICSRSSQTRAVAKGKFFVFSGFWDGNHDLIPTTCWDKLFSFISYWMMSRTFTFQHPTRDVSSDWVSHPDQASCLYIRTVRHLTQHKRMAVCIPLNNWNSKSFVSTWPDELKTRVDSGSWCKSRQTYLPKCWRPQPGKLLIGRLTKGLIGMDK